MNAENYYVENQKGDFAIVEVELMEQVKKTDKDLLAFIRPMHGREDWSNTISHEERENKTYFKINNRSDIEDFLAD